MGGRRRSWSRSARLLVVLLALLTLPLSASAAAPEDDLEAAQERANRAAAELSDAETALAEAEDAVARVQSRVATLDARVGATRATVSQLAIRLYVEGTVPIIRILRMENANEVIRAQQYSHVIAGGSTDSLRRFRRDREDLEAEQTVLEQEQEAHASSLDNLEERRADAIEELERLSEVVARAEAARQAERRAQAVAAAGASAEASSAERSISATPAPLSSSAPSTSAPVSPPADEPADESPADDGPADDGPVPDWICPVRGPHAFSNDYGAPRGGGFSHQGNDILAARGTPVVASVDGDVRHRSGAVSGLAYYLDGDNGDQYFGAHLDSFGASGRVTVGTVVGYVGNTGDAAATAPHLHFEIHPGGSGYENPYPTLVKYC